jgi:hypothetical protein
VALEIADHAVDRFIRAVAAIFQVTGARYTNVGSAAAELLPQR